MPTDRKKRRDVEAKVKLQRPRAGTAVPRDRLFQHLDALRDRPIVWVTGPAGSGKTTLLTTWIEARALPCVWYQLGPEDADLSGLFYHLGLAAARHDRDHDSLPLLTIESRPGIAGFSRLFFQLLAILPPSAALVFDNVEQGPEDAAWQEALAAGLDLIPPGITVFFLSRNAPPAAFARHRARQQLHVLGWNDLRLTADEAGAVARNALGKSGLPGEQIRRATHLADGWAAGLILLLEWARTAGEIPSAHESPLVFDYFAAEVFNRFDPETQRFLLGTALLPSATAAMAAELTGLPDAAKLFADLHAKGLFTERHSGAGAGADARYAYHPAFRQFLLHRLAGTLPAEQRAALEERAATVLAGAGQVEEALPLLTRAGRADAAAKLLASIAPDLYAQGRTDTLGRWLAELPTGIFDDSPWLRHWRGLCRLVAGQDGALDDLSRALDLFAARGDATGVYATWAELVEAHALVFIRLDVLDELLARLDALRAGGLAEPDADVEHRVAAATYMAVVARRPGDPSMPALRERALRLAARHAPAAFVVRVAAYMLIQDVLRGDEHAEAVVRAVQQLDRGRLPALVGLSWAFAHSLHTVLGGRPREALAIVEEGLALARASGVPVYTAQLVGNAALAAILDENLDGARARLAELEALTSHAPYAPRAFLETYLAIASGDVTGALARLRRMEAEMSSLGYGMTPAYVCALQALIHATAGNRDEASAAVTAGLAHADTAASPLMAYSLLCIDADRLLAAADPAGPDRLRAAFSLGAARRLASARMLLPRPLMERLAGRALAAGLEVAHARAVLAAYGVTPRIEVRTLGGFSTSRAGLPLAASRKLPRRPLELLKALVAFGERDIPEATLVDALWPDVDGDAGHEALAITLRRLRRLLDDKQAVSRAGNRLTIDPTHIWTDVRALRTLLGNLDEQVGSADAATLTGLVRELLGLYRGDFLPDEDLAFAIEPRERMREQLVRRVAAAGARLESLRAWSEAAACYAQALEVAPAAVLKVALARCQRVLGI